MTRTVTKGNANGPAATFDHVGGGLYKPSLSHRTEQCTFIDNHAIIGGGVYSSIPGVFPTELYNCAFISNTAEKGGGSYIETVVFGVYNCTFSGNVATNTDPSLSDNSSALAFGSGVVFGQAERCIFWGNGLVEDDDIKATDRPGYTIKDCIVELDDENTTLPGEGNLNQDPLFIDRPDLEDPIANLRLQAGSPAIDATVDGERFFFHDIDNIVRPNGNWDDLGAYEYVFPNN